MAGGLGRGSSGGFGADVTQPGYVKIANMAIEIVDFPIKHCDFPLQNVSHYQRVCLENPIFNHIRN